MALQVGIQLGPMAAAGVPAGAAPAAPFSQASLDVLRQEITNLNSLKDKTRNVFEKVRQAKESLALPWYKKILCCWSGTCCWSYTCVERGWPSCLSTSVREEEVDCLISTTYRNINDAERVLTTKQVAGPDPNDPLKLVFTATIIHPVLTDAEKDEISKACNTLNDAVGSLKKAESQPLKIASSFLQIGGVLVLVSVVLDGVELGTATDKSYDGVKKNLTIASLVIGAVGWVFALFGSLLHGKDSIPSWNPSGKNIGKLF